MARETRAYEAQIGDVDEAKRTVVSTINTAAIDRYKTLIAPDGGSFDNYRRNPVVLYMHGSSKFPVGRNLWIKSPKGRLIAKTEFLPLGIDETADKVFDLYRLGFLNAWSISFDPSEYGPPTPEEIRKRPDLAECRCVFRKWDLLEYSVVDVPGNAEATRQAFARGLALPGWEAPVAASSPATPPVPELPPIAGRSYAAIEGAILRQIRELARPMIDQAMRDAHDLARGKV